MMVTSVECVEVFIEIAARKYATPTVRWILILAVQLIKLVNHEPHWKQASDPCEGRCIV